MDWVTTCMIMEEVGTLGYEFACVFGVGAELVCDAIMLHGTDKQKEKYVKPLLKGELFAAECLTEPRGGSDFFGATTKAEDKGDYYLYKWSEALYCRGRRCGLFPCLRADQSRSKATGSDNLLCCRSRRWCRS